MTADNKTSGRRAAVTKFVAAAAGKVEAFYFAFGQDDVFLFLDLSENIVAAALLLVNNSGGNVRATYTPIPACAGMSGGWSQSSGSTLMIEAP